MMNLFRTGSVFVLLLLTGVVFAGGGNNYQKQDGTLKHTLQVKDVQGGFAGFTGWLWKVEPNGQWTKYQVFNRRLTAKKNGKLTAAQLGQVAKALSKYQALKLKGGGTTRTNPHIITVEFGKHKTSLNLGIGAPLPKASTKTEEGRFGGLVRTMQKLMK